MPVQVPSTHPYILFPKTVLKESVARRFESQVQQYPNQLALIDETKPYTYADLNQQANKIAHYLLAQLGPTSQSVALLLTQPGQMLSAMIGCLKANKFFVALDPHFPQSRLAYMFTDSQAAHLLTDTSNLALAQTLQPQASQLCNLETITLDQTAANPNLTMAATEIAYLVYTSGSTGEPKGIIHTHRNLLHTILNYTNAFHISPTDRLTALHSYSFSSGLIDIFCALLNGATLCPWQVKDKGFIGLADWLNENQVTIFNWAPTPFRSLGQTFSGAETFPYLRLLVLGGEPVTRHDVGLYQRHFSKNCLFVNRLGTSETNNFRLFFLDQHTPLAQEVVPVGYSVADKTLSLIDEHGQDVGTNQVGEITITSPYIALGYWGKPELTARAFKTDPHHPTQRTYFTGDLGLLKPDGCLVHLGRKDFQVKVRGQRIETSEIETALMAQPEIQEVAVATKPNQTEENVLIAYYVSKTGQPLNLSALREALQQNLPDYMIPLKFVSLAALPTTPTGKTDYRALPNPFLKQPIQNKPFQPPESPLEMTLAEIWQEVLGVDSVGLEDDFLALGGHSLQAAQALARINLLLDVQVAMPDFFQHTSLADLTSLIESIIIAEIELLSDDEIQIQAP